MKSNLLVACAGEVIVLPCVMWLIESARLFKMRFSRSKFEDFCEISWL
jgi:hypothetical protein